MAYVCYMIFQYSGWYFPVAKSIYKISLSAIMILMIGTGHVFRIAESVSFIIKNTWPDAVLVELDDKRYAMMTEPDKCRPVDSETPRIYRKSAKYQDKVAAQNDTRTGSELLVAINTGKLIGADILCIDCDAEKVMEELWNEMSFTEKRRYKFSEMRDSILGKRKADETQKDFASAEKEYMESMRRRYPTLVRKLIDERNVFMAEKIREASEKYESIAVVVGDAHVEGISDLLGISDIRKIRLAELLDKTSMDRIKSQIWNNGKTKEGSE